LLEEIARGGMGAVYRARQAGLNRQVAVKVLLAGHFASPSFLQRFRREAEAAASLNHPNIVSIYEVGEHEGQPYFSMALIEGRSLADLVRDQPLPARQAAQLLKTIAEAVHYAHERGVLHRDLKPSNVLVDAQGVPHVTDFGLAKRIVGAGVSVEAGEKRGKGEKEQLSAAPLLPFSSAPFQPEKSQSLFTSAAAEDLTLTGQVLGSPNYMPPEQADPKRGPTTAASDVYSLGAILYQLLTGRAPFLAETLTQTLRLVAETEAVSPRLLSPGVPRDLETICARCLEKDPQRRYASAQELADELGRFLHDEPTRARPIGPVARLARWCRRMPALAFSFGAGLALLLVIVIGSPIALVRINAARNAAEAARETAETARQQEAGLRARAESAERATEQQLYTALLEQARARMVSGEMGHRVQALEALRRAAAISNSVELRREAMTALTLPDLRLERELTFEAGTTLAIPDPSFERMAVNRGRGPVWDLSSGGPGAVASDAYRTHFYFTLAAAMPTSA
jgi:predicted Ser/Thr protein kinase